MREFFTEVWIKYKNVLYVTTRGESFENIKLIRLTRYVLIQVISIGNQHGSKEPLRTWSCLVLGFENELIAVYLGLTSVPPLAVFPCIGLLFPWFFIWDPMLVSSSWYSCEFFCSIPRKRCPVNKESLELSIVNKKLFTMWKIHFSGSRTWLDFNFFLGVKSILATKGHSLVKSFNQKHEGIRVFNIQNFMLLYVKTTLVLMETTVSEGIFYTCCVQKVMVSEWNSHKQL